MTGSARNNRQKDRARWPPRHRARAGRQPRWTWPALLASGIWPIRLSKCALTCHKSGPQRQPHRDHRGPPPQIPAAAASRPRRPDRPAQAAPRLGTRSPESAAIRCGSRDQHLRPFRCPPAARATFIAPRSQPCRSSNQITRPPPRRPIPRPRPPSTSQPKWRYCGAPGRVPLTAARQQVDLTCRRTFCPNLRRHRRALTNLRPICGRCGRPSLATAMYKYSGRPTIRWARNRDCQVASDA